MNLELASLPAAALLTVLLGCSVNKAVANAVADNASGGVYARDDDPELVRAAVPFGLKTMEGLLEKQPEHEGLLLALASGFTQYAYAYVQGDAEAAELAGRFTEARALRDRARRLYLRARDYGLRGLEARHEGMAKALRGVRDLGPKLERAEREDVPFLYWTAASWALAISNGKDSMALVAQLPVPGALATRALALDPSWDEGTLHEFFISWEAAQGGPDGAARAREHLDRALELSRGRKLGPLVSYAEAVAVPQQDRAKFKKLLGRVLAADPDADPPHRLANVLAQRRAKLLLAHADELFAE